MFVFIIFSLSLTHITINYTLWQTLNPTYRLTCTNQYTTTEKQQQHRITYIILIHPWLISYTYLRNFLKVHQVMLTSALSDNPAPGGVFGTNPSPSSTASFSTFFIHCNVDQHQPAQYQHHHHH